MKTSCRGAHTAKWILAFLLLPASLLAEPVPLKRVVELALTHATGAAIAAADEQRAAAGYRELRNNYIPQLSTGAGLGYSYGFPLALEGSAPSLFNITAQSALLNPSLRDFVRAAKVESAVASLKSKDERNQIIQDAALSYAELAKWEQRLARLQETEADANKMQAAVAERVKEGIDSELDGTRARLSAARVRLRIAEAQGAADVLREHLSKLTGLPAASIQTDPDSIPAPPRCLRMKMSPRTAASNPSVQAAVEHARAQYLRAQGEHRALWPSIDFAAQYALLSKFNNYQNYYIPSQTLHLTPLGECSVRDQQLPAEQRHDRREHPVPAVQRVAAFPRPGRRRRCPQSHQAGGSRPQPGFGRNSAPAALRRANASRARRGPIGI